MLRNIGMAVNRALLPVRLRQLPAPVRRVLQELGHAWLVGGCVRDLLLGRRPRDWDVVTALPPEAVARRFPRTVALKEGTVLVLMAGTPVEVTSLRGHDLAADLAARDFTINALALGTRGQLIDPLGGYRDLRGRLLRGCLDPGARFEADPVRMWRAVRLAAEYGLTWDPATREAIPPRVHRLAGVAPERLRDELVKLLCGPRPAWGLEEARRLGLVAASLPELLPMVGCEQNRFHAYPVWEHTLLTVAGAPDRLPVRLAALLHDIGKPHTVSTDAGGERHFYGHAEVGAEMAGQFLGRLRFERALQERVVRLVRHHMVLVYDPTLSDAAVMRMVRKVGRDCLEDQLALWVADGRATGKARVDPALPAALLYKRVQELERRRAPFGVRDLAVDGWAVMAALSEGPGPRIGAALRWLLAEVEAGRVANDQAALLQHLKNWPARGHPPDTSDTPGDSGPRGPGML